VEQPTNHFTLHSDLIGPGVLSSRTPTSPLPCFSFVGLFTINITKFEATADTAYEVSCIRVPCETLREVRLENAGAHSPKTTIRRILFRIFVGSAFIACDLLVLASKPVTDHLFVPFEQYCVTRVFPPSHVSAPLLLFQTLRPQILWAPKLQATCNLYFGANACAASTTSVSREYRVTRIYTPGLIG